MNWEFWVLPGFWVVITDGILEYVNRPEKEVYLELVMFSKRISLINKSILLGGGK